MFQIEMNNAGCILNDLRFGWRETLLLDFAKLAEPMARGHSERVKQSCHRKAVVAIVDRIVE